MKPFSSILLLAGLATASPVARQTTGPYDITNFSASKVHLSGYCNFAFDVAAPGLSAPSHCTAYLDAGFSGATWLANVYEGAGKCDNAAVSWTFFQPTTTGSGATLNVTVDGVKGRYAIPAEDITVRLNSEPNPFDNDVAYTGSRAFEITEFVE
jgi:hypothetical protein